MGAEMTNETKSAFEEWYEARMKEEYCNYVDCRIQTILAFEAGQRSKQLPEFTDEEIAKIALNNYEYCWAQGIDLNSSGRHGFVWGFKSALEQMRKKIGDV